METNKEKDHLNAHVFQRKLHPVCIVLGCERNPKITHTDMEKTYKRDTADVELATFVL